MRITLQDVVLRDYLLSDVEDEVRWTNVDTDWFYADTPWMELEPADPEELRRDMLEIMNSMPQDAIRWRFEIEVEGRHVGLVSSYYLGEDFSYYTRVAPAVLFQIGLGTGIPLHSSNFDFDEKALMTGLELYMKLAEME